MALIGAPDLIVLDEPTSALDPVVAAATMVLLSDFLQGRDTAMILITHDLGLAARRVDRLMVMEAGHLIEEGPTADILEHPQNPATKALCAHRNWFALPC
jgi:peptide/nickel transport system ATP-binding protein